MNASEPSAYYQPSSIFTFSVVTPVRQDPNEPASTLSRICSVRGCSFVIEAASTNKMCLTCRGKHRIYASTKRTRRKLEKAAVQGQTIMPVEQIPGSAAWMPGAIAPDPEQEPKKQAKRTTPEERRVSNQGTLSATAAAAQWDRNVVQPHFKLPSTSSELAGALTLSKDTASSSHPSAINLAGSPSAPNTQQDTQNQTVDVVDLEHLLSETSMGPRFCSVKGCKAIIPASYSYKMCEPCRNRYRGYGTKKRAKWKAEREASDRQDLRMVGEGKRKKQRRLSAFSESPEDLPTWEVSTNERLSLASTLVDANAPSTIAYAHPVQMIQDSPSSAASLEPSAIRADSPTIKAFPVRMCTVSHCHKVLPSNYLFKRCEQHRLQNRYHSKLKRVREKVIKAAGPLITDVDTNTHQASSSGSNADVNASSLVKSPRDSFQADGHNTTYQANGHSEHSCDNLTDPGEGWHLRQPCRTKQSEDSRPEQIRLSTEAHQVSISASEYCENAFLSDYDQESRDTVPANESSASEQHYTHLEPSSLLHSMLSRPALTANGCDSFQDPVKVTSAYPLSSSEVMTSPDNPPVSAFSPISFLFRPAEGSQQRKYKAGTERHMTEVQLSGISGSQGSQVVRGSESRTSDPTCVSTSNDQHRPQEASQQTVPPLPLPYLSPATISQYPVPYYIPHPYAYTVPFPPNSNASTSAMPPYLTGYPYVYPGYAYSLPVPYHSPVQAKLSTASRYEATAAKRQKKRTSTRRASGISGVVQAPEKQKSPDTAQNDSAAIVFSHYKPEAAKRKRSKVMHPSPEQVEEMRTQFQRSKGHRTPEDDITSSTDSLQRECGSRKCHRKLPLELAGSMCSKCRTKFIKKHQAKTKQTKERLKLEPRKVIIHTLKAVDPPDRIPLEVR